MGLTREQVVADFKLNILPPLKKIVGNDITQIKEYFKLNLIGLSKDRQISDKQRDSWKLTEKDLI